MDPFQSDSFKFDKPINPINDLESTGRSAKNKIKSDHANFINVSSVKDGIRAGRDTIKLKKISKVDQFLSKINLFFRKLLKIENKQTQKAGREVDNQLDHPNHPEATQPADEPAGQEIGVSSETVKESLEEFINGPEQAKPTGEETSEKLKNEILENTIEAFEAKMNKKLKNAQAADNAPEITANFTKLVRKIGDLQLQDFEELKNGGKIISLENKKYLVGVTTRKNGKQILTIVNYSEKQKIGKGAYATVYKALNLTGSKEVSLKVASDDNTIDDLQNEYKLLEIIGEHKGIVKFSMKGRANNSKNNVIVGRLYDFNLHDGIRGKKSIGVGRTSKIEVNWELKDKIEGARQLLDALAFLHANKIGHGDISSDNVLVRQKNGRWEFAIADFGGSMDFEDNLTKEKLNDFVDKFKPFFSSITDYEQAVSFAEEENIEGSKEIGKKRDVFCMGVLLYALLTGGKKPYPDGRIFLDSKMPFNRKPLEDYEIPEDVIVLIESMLTDNYSGRISAEEAYDKMNNFVMNNYDFFL